PDLEGRREHGVLGGLDVRRLRVPRAAVDDDLVAHADVRHFGADRIDHPGGVTAADMEVGIVAHLRVDLDDVDGDAEGGPDVVVVDAGGHYVDQHLARADLGGLDDLLGEGLDRLPEVLPAHGHRVHLRRHVADGRRLADLVQVLGDGSHGASAGIRDDLRAGIA